MHMMRKAGIDIPSYIAEGCGKPSDAGFLLSVNAAIAVSSRLEYYAILAKDLKFLDEDTHESYENDDINVRRMMLGLGRRLEN